MEIHYGYFCPKCDTDILIKKANVTGLLGVEIGDRVTMWISW